MAKTPDTFETLSEAYSVTSVLGEGGAGRVFAVKDTSGAEFALKCLLPERITSERKKRFKNEIDFCSKYQHGNLIRIIDSGLVAWGAAKCPFYVMPRFPATLRALLDKGIPQDRVLVLFDQMLSGVQAAHLLGVIHRDLKPENVLSDPGKSLLVVTDFGIAHFAEDIIATDVETKPAAKMFNRDYAAPEQRARGAKVGHRADIFALGLMLNEMFTGVVPLGAGPKTIASVSAQHAYLDSIVEQMIQQSAESRPTSIEEIKKELIARGNEFVALQQLDAKKREVVPANVPEQVAPVTLVGFDWQKNVLTLRLNRVPEPGWVERFKHPREGYSSLMGATPAHFQFRGDTATVGASDRDAQDIMDHFKKYIVIATRGYQTDLKVEAASRHEEQRRKLEQERAEADARARVLGKLKI